MNQLFYKGVLQSDLECLSYIPGSITTDLKEAQMWADRIASRKRKGAARHIRHGKSVVIAMLVDTSNFLKCDAFQQSGMKEHDRPNCWMNAVKSKAQVNTPVSFVIL